jgi:hypothetical protein
MPGQLAKLGYVRREGGIQMATQMKETKVDTYIFSNMTRLKELRIAHRDLDDVITRLNENPLVDQLQMKRLKKRKLMLKDQIARLESELIPDLNA